MRGVCGQREVKL